MIIPKLIIHDDAQRDADMVWRFLHHVQSPRYAQYIFKSHPEIGEFSNDENKVRAWVAKWHMERETKLRDLIHEQERIIDDKGGLAFSLLASCMEYVWQPGTEYIANLSLLPFSPFEKNEFFYSVLNDFAEKKSPGRSLLTVAIHEISHFIFFEYLHKTTARSGWKLGQDAVYLLKEALTTAMMNFTEFHNLLGTESHGGNPELHNIFIGQSPEPVLLATWMEAELRKMRDTGTGFPEWITRVIGQFHESETELSERMKLWREYGSSLKNNPAILAEYRKPIILIS